MIGLPLLLCASALVVSFGRRALVLVRVHGASMEPTLADGDRLLVWRGGTVRRGQIVVFEAPGAEHLGPRKRWVVKRVATAAGNSITVLGDNPAASVDSRHFGPVPAERMLGPAIAGPFR